MNLIDTHSHIFVDDFNEDRDIIIQNALIKGVQKIILPNIDSESVGQLLQTAKKYPDICFPLIGLHPTSVSEDFENELNIVEYWLSKEKFYGIGEIGIDLYWDKTLMIQQVYAFRHQLNLAIKLNLPVSIHSRNSLTEIFQVLKEFQGTRLTGVLHCFSGTKEEAEMAINMNFKLGIGGPITYKNSEQVKFLHEIGLEHIILETDSPWLPPVPHRGKRNESAYIALVAQKLAEIYNISVEEIAEITTKNATTLFRLSEN
jgi:TatD DNase family protein